MTAPHEPSPSAADRMKARSDTLGGMGQGLEAHLDWLAAMANDACNAYIEYTAEGEGAALDESMEAAEVEFWEWVEAIGSVDVSPMTEAEVHAVLDEVRDGDRLTIEYADGDQSTSAVLRAYGVERGGISLASRWGCWTLRADKRGWLTAGITRVTRHPKEADHG